MVTTSFWIWYVLSACQYFYMVLNRAHWLVIRDKRSLEFTRSLMKLFKTGSATDISDCQKFFGFLPITYQIDTRTARFLATFMISNNGSCMLFERRAKIGRNKIFSTYIRWRPFSVRLEMCHWWTVFSQPSIYIDGWLYGMRMTSVTFRCCLKTIPHIIILSSRHESDIPSLPGRQVSSS